MWSPRRGAGWRARAGTARRRAGATTAWRSWCSRRSTARRSPARSNATTSSPTHAASRRRLRSRARQDPRDSTRRLDGLEATDQIAHYTDVLDSLGQTPSVLELVRNWLIDHRRDSDRTCVVHGDFRLGNVIVGADGLRAVIDWELAHLGDPMEDLGWLCVKAWRFGSGPPVAGLGEYDELFGAYEAAGGGAGRPGGRCAGGRCSAPGSGRSCASCRRSCTSRDDAEPRARSDRTPRLRERIRPVSLARRTLVTMGAPHDAPTLGRIARSRPRVARARVIPVHRRPPAVPRPRGRQHARDRRTRARPGRRPSSRARPTGSRSSAWPTTPSWLPRSGAPTRRSLAGAARAGARMVATSSRSPTRPTSTRRDRGCLTRSSGAAAPERDRLAGRELAAGSVDLGAAVPAHRGVGAQ